MTLKFESNEQSEDNALRDKITACMDTGNHGRARTLMSELKYLNEVLYESVRMDVLHEYGMSL